MTANKKYMKNKLINYRISEDFDVFLESMWRVSKYRDIGIKSKSDLFRYAVIKTIGKDFGFDVLKKFNHVDEIHRFLNPKPVAKPSSNLDALEYLRKRQSGEIKFEEETDQKEIDRINKLFDKE